MPPRRIRLEQQQPPSPDTPRLFSHRRNPPKRRNAGHWHYPGCCHGSRITPDRYYLLHLAFNDASGVYDYFGYQLWPLREREELRPVRNRPVIQLPVRVRLTIEFILPEDGVSFFLRPRQFHPAPLSPLFTPREVVRTGDERQQVWTWRRSLRPWQRNNRRFREAKQEVQPTFRLQSSIQLPSSCGQRRCWTITLLLNGHRRESATTGPLAGREQSDAALPVLLENRVAAEEHSRHPGQGHGGGSSQRHVSIPQRIPFCH